MRSRECALLAWLFALCAPLTSAASFASFPAGDPPAVPYLQRSVLHLPNGERVPIRGADVEVMDATPRGTMLLVERRGPGFDSDYVWVTPDGGRTVFRDTRTHGVQGAVVSPDGRWFARGGEVIDLRDGSVVAAVPRAARVLTGWTASGVVYDDRWTTYLWQPGEQPVALEDRIRFPNRTDVGLVAGRGCRSVVHVYPGWSYTEEWGTQCGEPGALTVSPGGEWIVDRRLRLVDAAQEQARELAGPDVRLPAYTATAWESDHVVLIALRNGVLRCDALAEEQPCEWALARPAELPLR